MKTISKAPKATKERPVFNPASSPEVPETTPEETAEFEAVLAGWYPEGPPDTMALVWAAFYWVKDHDKAA